MGEAEVGGGSLRRAGILLAAFFLYRWATPLIPVPLVILPIANLISTALFLGLPMSFVYQVGRPQLPASRIVLSLAAAILLLIGGSALLGAARLPASLAAGVEAVRQVCLIAGAGAIGLLVARIVRDPNLLVPIAPVLALVDMITVLTPIGVAKQIMEQRPEVFKQVAVSVPKFGSAVPLAFMGPADILFLAMFFAVLHRNGFRARQTLLALWPTLVAYMLIVLLFGWVRMGRFSLESLPALVPMGIVILAVNWRCFSLSRQEKAMSAVLVVCAGLFAAYAFSLPSPQG